MSASTISAMVWPAFASGAGGVSVAGWRFWGGELSLRSSLWRSRGEGDRRRRRWWRGSDVASSPLRQRFALLPPHGFATGRIKAGSGHFYVPFVSSEVETPIDVARSEEHTSELQSLMRISYAVFC